MVTRFIALLAVRWQVILQYQQLTVILWVWILMSQPSALSPARTILVLFSMTFIKIIARFCMWFAMRGWSKRLNGKSCTRLMATIIMLSIAPKRQSCLNSPGLILFVASISVSPMTPPYAPANLIAVMSVPVMISVSTAKLMIGVVAVILLYGLAIKYQNPIDKFPTANVPITAADVNNVKNGTRIVAIASTLVFVILAPQCVVMTLIAAMVPGELLVLALVVRLPILTIAVAPIMKPRLLAMSPHVPNLLTT